MRPAPGASALMAEFGSAGELLTAVRSLRDLGYVELEMFSPYPLPGAEEVLRLRRPRLPRVVLAAGIAGVALGFGVQWFTNARSYPLDVGGRPRLAVPAWIPITFEIGVLVAALATFFGVLIAMALPRYWHPVFEIDGFERGSSDRFWIGIGSSDPAFDAARSRTELERLNPLRIVATGAPQ